MHDWSAPDNKHSALKIIDVQRDFTLSGGSAEIPGTTQDIPYIQDLTQSCKKLGYPVIHAVKTLWSSSTDWIHGVDNVQVKMGSLLHYTIRGTSAQFRY
jgi:isochorismate hydrolase